MDNDEWDDFLNQNEQKEKELESNDMEADNEESSQELDVDIDMQMTTEDDLTSPSTSPSLALEQAISSFDLSDFSDNAEVLIQVSRGESLSQMSSGSGIWLNSDTPPITKTKTKTSQTSSHMATKRSLKPQQGTAVTVQFPVANSFTDLTRALTGNPLLSHPISQFQKSSNSPHQNEYELVQNTLTEVDSFGLFFYGAVGGVKVVSNGSNEDFMLGVRIKKSLEGVNLLHVVEERTEDVFPLKVETTSVKTDSQSSETEAHPPAMNISLENLKIIATSIPPNGRTSWLIPFTLTLNETKTGDSASASDSRTIDLLSPPIVPDFATSPVDALYELYYKRICEVSSKVSCTTRDLYKISIYDDDNLQINLHTFPSFVPISVSLHFRGAAYPSPAQSLLDPLFHRQSNFAVEVDSETATIRTTKLYMPRFDNQAKIFLLLKSLHGKLSKLHTGQQYYLSHTANTPIIKILTFNK